MLANFLRMRIRDWRVNEPPLPDDFLDYDYAIRNLAIQAVRLHEEGVR